MTTMFMYKILKMIYFKFGNIRIVKIPMSEYFILITLLVMFMRSDRS